MDLDQILNMENEIDRFLAFCHKHVELPILLYGNGAGVHWYVEFAKTYGLSVSVILDKNVKKGSRQLCEGICVENAEEAMMRFDKAIVIVSAPKYRKEITEELKEKKPGYFIFSFDPAPSVIQGIWMKDRSSYYACHKEAVLDVYQALEDAFSKKTLEHILKGSVTNNCDWYEDIANESQYFPDIMKQRIAASPDRGGVYVDVGAFTGDTICEFKDAVCDDFKKYYAFEPDPNNFEALYQNFKDDSRIVMMKAGCGSENTRLSFVNEVHSESSHVVRETLDTTSTIEVVRLDDVIKEKVDYIKMDVEGMEMDVLKGATKILNTYKPALAISVYHKIEDIIAIPEFVLSLGLGYKIYLRHYWNCNGTDTILFAM